MSESTSCNFWTVTEDIPYTDYPEDGPLYKRGQVVIEMWSDPTGIAVDDLYHRIQAYLPREKFEAVTERIEMFMEIYERNEPAEFPHGEFPNRHGD